MTITAVRSPWEGELVSIFHDSLPHWVVDYGCYAVTIRCAGSLPPVVASRMKEIHTSLKRIPSQSSDAQHFRRQLFHTLDASLDKGIGFAPFKDAATAGVLHRELCKYRHDGLRFPHFVIMPNHLHLLTNPVRFRTADAFQSAWQDFKARTGRMLNREIGRKGSFWQAGWYDRWVRDDVEYDRWCRYFEQNPVKASLCSNPAEYPWLK